MSRPTSDLLRLASIIAVFFIHSTGVFERGFHAAHDYVSQDFLAVVLNQLARFSVPIFVMLSGYGLAMKFASAPPRGVSGIVQFYKSRADKIAIPYLFWTVIFLILGGRLSLSAGPDLPGTAWSWISTYFDALFFHHADYHFYFFLIILECYLIFPVLIRVKSVALWFVLLIMQICFTSPAHLWFAAWHIPRPHFPSSFIVYWVFYFYTGILTARMAPHIAARAARLPKFTSLAAAGAALLVLLWEYVYWSFRNPEPGYYNHFHRQSVIAYSLIFWFLFIQWDGNLARFMSARPRFQKLVELGAALSFAGFIFHTQVLRLLEMTPFAWNVVLVSVSLVIVTFAAIYGLHRIIRPKFLRTICGLP